MTKSEKVQKGRPALKRLAPGLVLAAEAAGSMAELARRLNLGPSALQKWHTQIPAARVVDIERVTGVPREQLRPDLYR